MPSPRVSPDPLQPPAAREPFESPVWHQWFYQLYDKLLKDGGNFPTLGIQGPDGTIAKITTENQFQRLINIDHGWYVNYSADNGNIIYGYAANVRRSAGSAFAVAAQLNAYGGRGVTGGIWGIATEAWGQEGYLGSLTGIEPSVLSLESANANAKWAMYPIFKNRAGGTPVLGTDRYNYYAICCFIDSLDRSASGERCGWTKGIFFSNTWGDTQNPLVWNNSTPYVPGMVVTSGGFAWQCIQSNTNQVPAAVSIYWVKHNWAGVTAKAIGIDFSSVSVTTMGRMFSAIRLRDTMKFEWESTGALSSYFDQGGSNRLVLLDNAGTQWLSVEITTGRLFRNGVFLI
jgi:hypothetical protein